MANDIVVNGLIHFDMGDVEMEKFLAILGAEGRLVVDCPNCGTTLLPQARRQHAATLETEFRVSCVHCERVYSVRMYGSGYGFVLPTDDEFFRSGKGMIQ